MPALASNRENPFLKLLKEYPDHDLLTFGANGIVRTKLNYIEKTLKKYDFCFLERTKKIDGFGKISDIYQIKKILDKRKKRISPKLLAKLVLLGTHGIQNNKSTRKVIKRWINLVEDKILLNQVYSDMGLFVQSMFDIMNQTGYVFKKSTWAGKDRSTNPYCDTGFHNSSNIWFAKSRTKWQHPKYLKSIKHYQSLKRP